MYRRRELPNLWIAKTLQSGTVRGCAECEQFVELQGVWLCPGPRSPQCPGCPLVRGPVQADAFGEASVPSLRFRWHRVGDRLTSNESLGIALWDGLSQSRIHCGPGIVFGYCVGVHSLTGKQRGRPRRSTSNAVAVSNRSVAFNETRLCSNMSRCYLWRPWLCVALTHGRGPFFFDVGVAPGE